MVEVVEVTNQVTKRLERAYQLAFFILGNQEASERIAVEAADRLQVAVVTQDRRYYYIPQGSSRQLSRATGARSKVNFSELHLLQRLVFDETESEEKEQERAGLDDRRLLIHFLKHLVRITVKRNSFYVTLGFTRLLHHYSINEAISLYGLLMQNPSRAKDNYYWRSRKAQLLQEMKSRFGDLLTMTRGAYGEERFVPRPDQARYADFITLCLNVFMPWETQCPLPVGESPTDGKIRALSFEGDDPDEEHRTEVARMHAVLHTECFDWLVTRLAMDPHILRLDLPEFNHHKDHHDQQSTDGNYQMTGNDQIISSAMRTKLPEKMIEMLPETLKARQTRRQAVQRNLRRVKVLVDRQPRATLDLQASGQAEFRLLEGEEFIEIRSSEEPDLCLALYPVDYVMLEQASTPQIFVIELAGGQKLNFLMTPDRNAEGEVTGASVTVNVKGSGFVLADWLRSLLSGSEHTKQSLPAWRFALPALLLVVCGLGSFALWRFWQPESSSSIAINRPPNGDQRIAAPNGDNSGAPSPAPKNAIEPQRPSKPPSTLRDHDVTDNDLTPEIESPKQIRNVFLSLNRDANQFRTELARRLQEAHLWELTSKDDADTALDIELSADGRTASIRLINAKGRVIWPRNGKSQKYLGDTAQISERIVTDLKTAARK